MLDLQEVTVYLVNHTTFASFSLDRTPRLLYTGCVMTTPQTSVNDLLAKLNDSKRAVARLMARENITVQVLDGADTARFDTVRRVLTIPNWSKMTVDQADLLLAHEVGHALFTDNAWIAEVKGTKGLFSYINVVEDARIERKMKAAFPGLARVFYNGYSQFHQNGPIFQGTRTHLKHPRTGAMIPIASMSLIDRINLHFKIGAFVDVPFAHDERGWVAKIERVSSLADVIEIAKALHALAKDRAETAQDQPEATPPSAPQDSQDQDSQDQDSQDQDASGNETADDASDDEGTEAAGGASDDEDADEDGNETADEASDDEGTEAAGGASDDEDADEDDEAETGTSETPTGDTGAGNGDEPDPESLTDEAMSDALKNAAEKRNDDEWNALRNVLYEPLAAETLRRHIVPAAEYVDRCDRAFATAGMWPTDTGYATGYASILTYGQNLEREWVEKFGPTARQMAQEFNRRKNARAQARALVSKTGKLNVNRLHAYKFSEDLFSRMTVMPRGQSHGLVMIIDASGSMSRTFADVLDQLLLFAHFCHYANVPFEAYMFTDVGFTRDEAYETRQRSLSALTPVGSLTITPNARLIGLINTAVDKGAFKRQVRNTLLLQATHRGSEYGYHTTDKQRPTAEGWMALTRMPCRGLGGTPLYSGIVLADACVGLMKTRLRLDKMTLVVISDGQDGDALQFMDQTVAQDGTVTAALRRLTDHMPVIVRDSVSKRTFSHVTTEKMYGDRTRMTQPRTATLTWLLDIVKARYGATTMYLHLEAGSGKKGGYRAMSSAEFFVRAGEDVTFTAEEYSDSVREKGHFAMANGAADATLIVPSAEMELAEDAFRSLNADQLTQRQVAKAFEKAMASRACHRHFVNAVVPVLA